MPQLLLLISLFVAIAAGITYLLHRVAKKWWIKYLPALIPFGVVVYSVFVLLFAQPREGFRDLATFLVVLLFAPSFLSVIVTGAILDYKNKKEKSE